MNTSELLSSMYIDNSTTDDNLSSSYVPVQRGTLGDLLHELVRGTGGSLTQLGQGLQQLGAESAGGALKGAGAYVQRTDLAKPDIDERLGVEEGFLKGTGRVIAGGIPDVAASAGSFIAGSAIGGPVVGTAATLGYLGTAHGAGAYKSAYEEALRQRPDMLEEDAKDYALREALANFAGEAVGTGISLASGGILGKAIVGAGVKSLIASGEYTASQVASSLFKVAGPKEFLKTFGLAGLGEGSSEVATELMNRANAETYGLERDPADLLTLFAGSAVLGSAPAGAAFVGQRGTVSEMRDAIQVGLNHEDTNIRTNVVNRLTEKLTNVDPDSAKAFYDKVMPLAQKGPVDIQMVLKGEQEKAEVTDRILNKPEEVLKEKLPSAPVKEPEYMGGELLPTPEERHLARLQEANRPKEVSIVEEPIERPVDPRNIEIDQQMAELPQDSNTIRKPLYEWMTDEDYLLVTESKLGVKPSDFKILQDTDAPAAESVKTSLQRISQYKQELSQTVIPEEREVLDKKIKSETRRVDNEFKNIGIDYKRVEPKVEPKVELRPDQLESLVDITLFDTENKKPMKMKAKDALKLIDEDLEIYQKLLKCVKGVA